MCTHVHTHIHTYIYIKKEKKKKMSRRRKKRRGRLYVAHKTHEFYFLALYRKEFPTPALEDSSANICVSPCSLDSCILKTMYIGSSVPIFYLFFFSDSSSIFLFCICSLDRLCAFSHSPLLNFQPNLFTPEFLV